MAVYSEKCLKRDKSNAYNYFCEMLSARSTYICHCSSKELNKTVNRNSYRQMWKNFVNRKGNRCRSISIRVVTNNGLED